MNSKDISLITQLQSEFGKEGIPLDKIYNIDIDDNLFYSDIANIDLISTELGHIINKDQFLMLSKSEDKGDRKLAYNIFKIRHTDETNNEMEDEEDENVKEKIQINNPKMKNYHSEFIGMNELSSRGDNNSIDTDAFYGTKFMHTK